MGEKSLIKRADRFLGNSNDSTLERVSQIGEKILTALKDTGAQGYNFMGQADLPEGQQQGPGAALAQTPGKLIYLRETVTAEDAQAFMDLGRHDAARAIVHESAHNITGNSDATNNGAAIYGRQGAMDLAARDPASAMGNPENLSFFFVP